MSEPSGRVDVSIIIPAFNEEKNVRQIYSEVKSNVGDLTSEILFIDDGSTDSTLEEIRSLAEQDPTVIYLSFSRNFGHQNALRAGFDYASGRCVISMDADLQHPPNLLPDMIAKWQEGFEVVNTNRLKSKTVPLLKRITARIFYALINRVSEVDISNGSADFRLLDGSVVEEIRKMNEADPFYRGLVPWLGYKQCSIPYIPNQRISGRSKYSIRRMMRFAIEGIMSFTTLPLRIATFVGFGMAITGFVIGVNAIIEHLTTDRTVPGWTSTVVLVVLVGGVQLVILGIIGEYLGKVFLESKKRPHYIVRESNYSGGAHGNRSSR